MSFAFNSKVRLFSSASFWFEEIARQTFRITIPRSTIPGPLPLCTIGLQNNNRTSVEVLFRQTLLAGMVDQPVR